MLKIHSRTGRPRGSASRNTLIHATRERSRLLSTDVHAQSTTTRAIRESVSIWSALTSHALKAATSRRTPNLSREESRLQDWKLFEILRAVIRDFEQTCHRLTNFPDPTNVGLELIIVTLTAAALLSFAIFLFQPF